MCAIGIAQPMHGFIVTKPQVCLEPCDDRLGLCRISSKPVVASMFGLGEPSCVPS